MPDRRSAAELLLRLTRRGLAWSGVLFSAAMFSAASPAAAEPSCPASTTLTPGSQNSPATAVLYCGGTYTDTWNAEGETDWIAFYTTQASATVVAHYEAVDTSGDEEHAVRATLFDPGSATEGPDELPPAGPVSAGNLEPLGLSYTFGTPGLHYVQMTPYFNPREEGTGYQLSLSGEWSQTPPAPAPSPPSSKGSKPAPTPPPCVVPQLGQSLRLSVIENHIRSAHCSVGRISYVHRPHAAKGVVVALNPSPGTRLTHGAKVSVLVSSGSAPQHRRSHERRHRNRDLHGAQQHTHLHHETISHCPEVYTNFSGQEISFSHIIAHSVSCHEVRSLLTWLSMPAEQWHCVYHQVHTNGLESVESGRCTKAAAYFSFTEEEE